MDGCDDAESGEGTVEALTPNLSNLRSEFPGSGMDCWVTECKYNLSLMCTDLIVEPLLATSGCGSYLVSILVLHRPWIALDGVQEERVHFRMLSKRVLKNFPAWPHEWQARSNLLLTGALPDDD